MANTSKYHIHIHKIEIYLFKIHKYKSPISFTTHTEQCLQTRPRPHPPLHPHPNPFAEHTCLSMAGIYILNHTP